MKTPLFAALGLALLLGCGNPPADSGAVRCGDGAVAGTEACDDGPDNGTVADACRPTCELPACGDGIRDSGEECDEGDDNADDRPGACRTTCRAAACGDGVVDAGEDCDDGAANGDLLADTCRTTCRLPSCGDGVVDTGEACDDGEENADDRPDACRTTCAAPACGDGVPDTGESCDDGEANSDLLPDRCRTDCGLPRCGDGVRDRGEGCDAGSGNSDERSGACRTTCVVPGCGDGVTDPGEECDGGTANSDTVPDACRLTCTLPRCGDGVVDRERGEACDDADESALDGCDRCVWRPECSGYRPIDVTAGVPWDGRQLSVTGTLVGAGGNGMLRYAVPAVRAGDLEVLLASVEGSFVPWVEIHTRCGHWPIETLALETAPGPGEPVRVRVPVHPSDTMLLVAVGSATGQPGPFELQVRILARLAPGEPCRVDGRDGSCGDGLACLDDDGDGLGSCWELVPLGGACDPAGRENSCFQGVCACPVAGCAVGTCVSTCGDGVIQAWEACDDGDLAAVDNCTAACLPAGGSCATPFQLHLAARPDGLYEAHGDVRQGVSSFTSSCDDTGGHPEFNAAFTAPAPGLWAFRVLRDSPSDSFAPVLSILEDSCNSGRELSCGNPERWPWPTLALELEAGETVWPIVDGNDMLHPDESGTFRLLAERAECGDGRTAMIEECDDGNAVDLDNCSNGCIAAGGSCATPWTLAWDDVRREAVWDGFLSRGSTSFGAACVRTSYQDVVARFVAPATGRYTFAATGASLVFKTGACEAATGLACGEGIDRAMAAGESVWVVLDGASPLSGRDRGPFHLLVKQVVCGDGELVLPEECDDGNLAAGDNCSADCRIEAMEAEPNDLQTTANDAVPGGSIAGSLDPSYDRDWYRFEAVAGVEYHLKLYAGLMGYCVEGAGGDRVSLEFGLFNATGPEYGTSPSPATGACDAMIWTAPRSDTYFVQVSRPPSPTPPPPVPRYLLEIR